MKTQYGLTVFALVLAMGGAWMLRTKVYAKQAVGYQPSAVMLASNVAGVATLISTTLTTGQLNYPPTIVLIKCNNAGVASDCNFAQSGGSGSFSSIASGTNSNSDLDGNLTVTNPATTATYTFIGTHTKAPVCLVQPQSVTPATSQSLSGFVCTSTTTGITITVGATPGAGVPVTFGYQLAFFAQ